MTLEQKINIVKAYESLLAYLKDKMDHCQDYELLDYKPKFEMYSLLRDVAIKQLEEDLYFKLYTEELLKVGKINSQQM